VQIAAELTSEGINAVPIFWMATEDHDLDEVRFTNWFADGTLRRFELPAPADAGKPVGKIALGEAVAEFSREAVSLLEKAGNAALAKDLAESYGPQETYGSAFGKLFARLFGEQGLILVDPLDEALHRSRLRCSAGWLTGGTQSSTSFCNAARISTRPATGRRSR